MKYLITTVIVVVIAGTIGGLWIAGSPKQARLIRFDEMRVGNLQLMQSEVVNYWQAKNVLPDNLALIKDDLRGIQLPVDPVSEKLYEYHKKGALTFELCAEFALATPDTGAGQYPKGLYPSFSPEGDNWTHHAGRQCFERTIDEDFYKMQKEIK